MKIKLYNLEYNQEIGSINGITSILPPCNFSYIFSELCLYVLNTENSKLLKKELDLSIGMEGLLRKMNFLINGHENAEDMSMLKWSDDWFAMHLIFMMFVTKSCVNDLVAETLNPAMENLVQDYEKFVRGSFSGFRIEEEKSSIICFSALECIMVSFWFSRIGFKSVNIILCGHPFKEMIGEVASFEWIKSCLCNLGVENLTIEVENLKHHNVSDKTSGVKKTNIIDSQGTIDAGESLCRELSYLEGLTTIITSGHDKREFVKDFLSSNGVGCIDISLEGIRQSLLRQLKVVHQIFVEEKNPEWLTKNILLLGHLFNIDKSYKRLSMEIVQHNRTKDVKEILSKMKNAVKTKNDADFVSFLEKILLFFVESIIEKEKIMEFSTNDFVRFYKAYFLEMLPMESDVLGKELMTQLLLGVLDFISSSWVGYSNGISFEKMAEFATKSVVEGGSKIADSTFSKKAQEKKKVLITDLRGFKNALTENIIFFGFNSGRFDDVPLGKTLNMLCSDEMLKHLFAKRNFATYAIALYCSKSVTFITFKEEGEINFEQEHGVISFLKSYQKDLGVNVHINTSKHRDVPKLQNILQKEIFATTDIQINDYILSPTSTERLIKNPFEFYIRNLLEIRRSSLLSVMNRVKRDESLMARNFGNAFHKMCDTFVKLMEKSESINTFKILEKFVVEFGLDFFHEYKLRMSANMVLEYLDQRKKEGYSFVSETKIYGTFLNSLNLESTPDLLLKKNENVVVVDYKTGQLPSFKDELRAKKLQMFFNAFCLTRGGFSDSKMQVVDMVYFGFDGKTFDGKDVKITEDKGIGRFLFAKKYLDGDILEDEDLIKAFVNFQSEEMKRLMEYYSNYCMHGSVCYFYYKSENEFNKTEDDFYIDIISRSGAIV